LKNTESQSAATKLSHAACFGVAAFSSYCLFDIATSDGAWVKTGDVRTFSIFMTLGGALGGYLASPRFESARDTSTLLESVVRSELVIMFAVFIAVVLNQIAGAINEWDRDPAGAVFKLLMIVPFAPITSLMAAIFTFWASLPPAFIAGWLIFAQREKRKSHPPRK
jgi:hypothetical protein